MSRIDRTALAEWAHRHRWAIAVIAAAFLIRLHWNLVVHPIGDYVYSDMNGYNRRANSVLSSPLSQYAYTVFFPPGTHWLLAGFKLLFGGDNYTAFGICYAAMGTGVVAYTYGVARRLSNRPAYAIAVTSMVAVYYPLISVGGYILSEIPFSLCLMGALFHLLRTHETGSDRHAWAVGLHLAAGTLIRPQLLMGAAAFGLYWLATRRHMPKITWSSLLRVAVPLVLALSFASARFYWHTGRVGLISDNGTINRVFGRCHNKGIYARPTEDSPSTIRFAPPPLIQLEAHTAVNPDSWIRLAPVFADHPEPIEGVDGFAVDEFGCTRRTCRIPGGEIEYRGYIADKELQNKIVAACIERSGLLRQAYFGFVHIVQLWGYNSMWPDQADPRPRPDEPLQSWRALAEFWRRLAAYLFAIPCLLGLGWIFRPAQHLGRALVGLQMVALFAVAFLYIGGVRFRIPYDPLMFMLSGLVFERVFEWVYARVRTRGSAEAPTA